MNLIQHNNSVIFTFNFITLYYGVKWRISFTESIKTITSVLLLQLTLYLMSQVNTIDFISAERNLIYRNEKNNAAVRQA